MLYDLAQKANISTRGVTVEIRRGPRNLHGVCYQYEKRIILWLLDSSKTDDIGFIWLHELAHLTPRNMRLGASGHGIKAQRQADAVAEKVLGITHKDLKWREKSWRTRGYPRSPTRKTALAHHPDPEGKYPAWQFRLIKIRADKKKWWVWQEKLR